MECVLSIRVSIGFYLLYLNANNFEFGNRHAAILQSGTLTLPPVPEIQSVMLGFEIVIAVRVTLTA